MLEPAPMLTTRWESIWRYGLCIIIMVASLMATLATFFISGYDFDATPNPWTREDNLMLARVIWLFTGDPLLGIISLALMRWRHRRPALIAAVVFTSGLVSSTANGPAAWMLGSLASHRRWLILVAFTPLLASGVPVQELIYPSGDPLPVWAMILMVLLAGGINIAIGVAMGSRRETIQSLHDRAIISEREQEQRVARAQASERNRIAREMHDVLAHRISLVAMHAGALTYRTDLSEEQRAIAAKTIEDNAHQALIDLRGVLGVLRDPNAVSGSAPERPQPVLADLADLVEDERAVGMNVAVTNTLDEQVPMTAGRTAYRVIQEALTNARKHAPNTAVTIELSGSPANGLSIAVRNARPVAVTRSALPLSGLGLVGLGERVSLAGGTFSSGVDPSGGYAVQVWLPWSS